MIPRPVRFLFAAAAGFLLYALADIAISALACSRFTGASWQAISAHVALGAAFACCVGVIPLDLLLERRARSATAIPHIDDWHPGAITRRDCMCVLCIKMRQ